MSELPLSSSSGETRAEWLLRWQSVLLLAFTALSVGGMEPWVPLPLLGLSLCALFPLLLARSEGRRVRWSRLLPALLWALYVGASLLNPSHAPNGAGGWDPLSGWVPWLPTTMDRWLTVQDASPLFAALVQGGCLAALSRGRRAQDRLLLSVGVLVLVLALLGALVWSTGARDMAWCLRVPGRQFFASFIYKNHWVAFSFPAACALAGLGLSLWDRGAGDRRASDLRLLCLGGAALILATFPLPGSRSGAVLAGLALLALLAGLLRRGLRAARAGRGVEQAGGLPARVRVWLFAGVALFVLSLLGVLLWLNWPSLEKGLDRTERQYTEAIEKDKWELRVYSFRDTVRMAEKRPWYGWGGGSFEPVFPLFQGDYVKNPRSGKVVLKYQDAHCDWAQFWAEYGLVGLVLLVVPAVLALVRTWRVGGVRSRWVFWGCLALLVYAVAEFPFQNLAALMLWSVLACTLLPQRSRRPITRILS